MKEKLSNWIRDNQILQMGDRIVVGVSGGADSVCLLSVLMEYVQMYQLEIAVLHVNHGLRGTEADRDEKYVESLCRSFAIPYCVRRLDVASRARECGCSCEEMGRILRYEALEQVRKEWNYTKIAVAHNQNDQAETILHQMCRGCRLSGLTGMSPVTGRIIRPLLPVNRKEIEAYLAEKQIQYMNDSTNAGNDYTRNRIRHQVLPLLEERVHNGATKHIADMASELREIEGYLDTQTDALAKKLIKRKEGELHLSIAALKSEPLILRKELIRKMLYELSGCRKDIEASHIRACCELTQKESGSRIALPYRIEARIEYHDLVLEQLTDSATMNREPVVLPLLAVGESYTVKVGSISLTADCIANSLENGRIPKNLCTKWVDYDKISKELSIRLSQEDDYFYVNEQGGRKKLNRYFIDQKFTRKEREQQLVVAMGHHIVWIPGKRGTETLHVTKDTRRILCLSIQRNDETGGYESERDN